jgi:FHS family L-fucose permease-like MFS transporter
MQITTSDKSSTSQVGHHSIFPETQLPLFILVTALFFLWGMSNNLTDILVQQFKKSFELSQFAAQLVQTANFLGYFCMAIPAALIMRRWGYKTGMILGLLLFGSGMILFWPAAQSGMYVFFLIALFTVGCGASTLETAANPFMAQFGSEETAARRLNFAQSFNPPGTIVGVMVGAQFIFSGVELKSGQIAAMKNAGIYASYLHSELLRVVPTYLILGSVVLLFALLLSRMSFPSKGTRQDGDVTDHGSFKALLHFPQLWISVLANFCNVGAQVATWSSLIPYMKQFASVSERTAAAYLTGTLVAMTLGRFVGTSLMKYVSPTRLLTRYGAINVGLMAVAIGRPGMLGADAIVVSSFFLSIMFPTIFAFGIQGLGPNTKLAGSFLVMSVAGGAVFPPLLGLIARNTGSVALGYVVPLAGFAVVSIYGFIIHRVPNRLATT